VQRAQSAGEDDADLGRLEERLAQLEHLQRKHRGTLSDVLARADAMRRDLDDLAAAEGQAVALGKARTDAEEELGRQLTALTAARERAAGRLQRALDRELAGLAMKGCRTQWLLEAYAAQREGLEQLSDGRVCGAAGAERVRLLVETNPGQGFRPVGEIASGGEMARVALALRVILGGRGRALLTVFDEIDAGLGATAARDVARRLQAVAAHRQVLLVTHLPVIAAGGARHFRVAKGARGGRRHSSITLLSPEDRVTEIARMLSGDGRDHEARAHAEVLLERR
jgi:DNA repair protein RecN (Recombination protein N)